jgi:hypothetical protein
MPRKNENPINVESVDDFLQLKNLLSSVTRAIYKVNIDERVKSREAQLQLDKLFQKKKASFVFNPHGFVDDFLQYDFESIIVPAESYDNHYSDVWYIHDNFPTFVDDAMPIIEECKKKLVKILESQKKDE